MIEVGVIGLGRIGILHLMNSLKIKDVKARATVRLPNAVMS